MNERVSSIKNKNKKWKQNKIDAKSFLIVEIFFRSGKLKNQARMYAHEQGHSHLDSKAGMHHPSHVSLLFSGESNEQLLRKGKNIFENDTDHDNKQLI